MVPKSCTKQRSFLLLLAIGKLKRVCIWGQALRLVAFARNRAADPNSTHRLHCSHHFWPLARCRWTCDGEQIALLWTEIPNRESRMVLSIGRSGPALKDIASVSGCVVCEGVCWRGNNSTKFSIFFFWISWTNQRSTKIKSFDFFVSFGRGQTTENIGRLSACVYYFDHNTGASN